MGSPLKNPPVYFTLAQVRFNTILKLADFLPSIQEAFRKSGFPDFGAQKQFVLQVGSQNGQPVPMPGVLDRFSFSNADKTHSFLLESGKLTFQSTDYGHFEFFSKAFIEGLGLVHECVQLDFTERVGLRYLDRVTPTNGDQLEQYLAPEVLGMRKRLGGMALHSFAETLTELSGIKLLSRVITQVGGLVFPPDLVPVNMAISPRLQQQEGLNAILDNDGFFEGREVFSLDQVARHLSAIHTVIGSAFRATVTEYAFQMWNQ
jgi:uncharacterized protein (TIGR04255 family)